jgi:hypothetical protein
MNVARAPFRCPPKGQWLSQTEPARSMVSSRLIPGPLTAMRLHPLWEFDLTQWRMGATRVAGMVIDRSHWARAASQEAGATRGRHHSSLTGLTDTSSMFSSSNRWNSP